MLYDVGGGVFSVAGLHVNLCARSPQGKSKGRVRPHVKRQAACLDTLIPIPENLQVLHATVPYFCMPLRQL
jgi:hypothetical protein